MIEKQSDGGLAVTLAAVCAAIAGAVTRHLLARLWRAPLKREDETVCRNHSHVAGTSSGGQNVGGTTPDSGDFAWEQTDPAIKHRLTVACGAAHCLLGFATSADGGAGRCGLVQGRRTEHIWTHYPEEMNEWMDAWARALEKTGVL